MPRINKPAFTPVPTEDLKKKLDKLGDAIKDATFPDGSVDVARVEDAVANDPSMRDAFEEVKDQYSRKEMRTVSGGCGGGTERREVEVDPTALDAGEVRNVMSALLDAKTRLSENVDKDGDGLLTGSEVIRPDAGAGHEGRIAADVVNGVTGDWKAELNEWREAVTEAVDKLDTRQDLDARIGDVAGRRAESGLGKEAIVWAYREVLASGGSVDKWDLDDKLKDAETSFLAKLPFFGSTVTDSPHLSDREVAGFLGTSDLAAFVAEKKAAITQSLGADYESSWLAGKDIVGVEQSDDPDFHRVGGGC